MVLIWRAVRFLSMMGPLRKLVPTFIRRRYALKFGIALVILGLSVGAIGYVGTNQIQHEVKGNVNDNYQSLANEQANSLESWDQSNRRFVSLLTGMDTLKGGSSKEMQTVLANVFTGQGTPEGAREILIVNNNGTVVSQTGGYVLQDEKVSKIGWKSFDQNLAKSIHESPDEVRMSGIIERNDERWVIYAQSIGTQKRFKNYIVAFVTNLDAYSNEMAADDYGPGEMAMLVNAQGEIIASEDLNQVGKQYPHEKALDASAVTTIGTPKNAVKQAIKAESRKGGQYVSEEYIVASASVENRDGWTVVYHVPKNEAYGFVTTVAEYGLLATLGGVLLIGLFGAVLGRNTATSIDRLTTKTAKMEDGNLDVDFETPRIDNIGRLYEGFANMRDALSERIQEAREAREEAEAARKEAEEMRDHLQRKAEDYSEVMQRAADGDLTQRLDPESQSQAMTDIAEEFNEMIAEIERTTEQLKNFASEVATSSEEVTASSEEVRSASQQVTESIQEISDGAERQNDSLQSVQQEMDSLSTTTEEIAASSNEVADIAERTAETGREGRDAAQEAIAGMSEIEEESEQAVQEIAALEREMEQIDELIEFISEIAEQTNMLALNANIEASRSGESGEGFSVVAQEVKELAEETKDAAGDIEERLERIQSQTHSTAEGVQRTADRVAEHTDSVRNAAEALEEIAGYAQETNTGVQEISAATEEQAASTQQVVAMVDEAATISEETTAESENVAAAAEEQTTALTEVSRSASDLAEQASRLSEALDRFDTDAEEGFEMPAPGEERSEAFLPSDGEEFAAESEEIEPPAEEPEPPAGTVDDEPVEDDVPGDEPLEFEPEFEPDADGSPTEEGTSAPAESADAEPPDPIEAEPAGEGATDSFDIGTEVPDEPPAGDHGAEGPEADPEDDEFNMIGFDDVTFEEESGDGPAPDAIDDGASGGPDGDEDGATNLEREDGNGDTVDEETTEEDDGEDEDEGFTFGN
jgi:methyl-accepting chemotaxis protein